MLTWRFLQAWRCLRQQAQDDSRSALVCFDSISTAIDFLIGTSISWDGLFADWLGWLDGWTSTCSGIYLHIQHDPCDKTSTHELGIEYQPWAMKYSTTVTIWPNEARSFDFCTIGRNRLLQQWISRFYISNVTNISTTRAQKTKWICQIFIHSFNQTNHPIKRPPLHTN